MAHKKVTAELCAIIEQFAFADCNKQKSAFYDREEPGAHVEPNRAAIDRFAVLLATPGLDTSVSTSKNNSLLAHMFMVIDCMYNVNPHRVRFTHTRHLLAILAGHPSTSEILNHGHVHRTTGDNLVQSCSIVSAILTHCDGQMYNTDDEDYEAAIAGWQPILALIELHKDVGYKTAEQVMGSVDHVTALALVNNPLFDAVHLFDVDGMTIFTETILWSHGDAVEAMLKMPNSLYSDGHNSTPENTKKMMRVILAHKDTDISRACLHINCEDEPNADSMMQMLGHESFDIHNIVIESGVVEQRHDGDGDQVDLEVAEHVADD